MSELESPHNNEQCICSSPEQLEERSLKDCKTIFKQFSAGINSMDKHIRACAKEAIEQTLKHRNKRTAKEVEICIEEFIHSFQDQVDELCFNLDVTVVQSDQYKCPFCQ